MIVWGDDGEARRRRAMVAVMEWSRGVSMAVVLLFFC